jgi:2-isopropylmalate synthase
MAFDFRKYQAFNPAIDKRDRRWPNQQIIRAPRWCAVDLRDGNQALVKPMTVEQKQKLFDLLVKIGIKEIEVGFPSASQPDFDFVRQLIEQNRVPDDVTIQVLTQARDELIERTFESLKGARRAVVHVYNATAPVWREKVFHVDRAGCIALAQKAAEKLRTEAARYPQTQWVFEYSPETFSNTEPDFIVDVVNAVTAVWQPQSGQEVIVNLPSTVEVSTPNVFADQVEWVCERLEQREHICISIHPHNDRGCGVATAEMSLLAGADRIEGTLMGNGERTGNVDLIVLAMNLYSQGVDPALDFSNMREVVATVEEVTDIKTHPRHPWVGDLVFAAFSGSHQDAIRKCMNDYAPGNIWDVAYLPIDPEDVGRRYEEVVRVNSQSGKGGVAYVLERDFGISLPRWLQQDFAKVVQAEAEGRNGEVEAATISQLFESCYMAVPQGCYLRGYDVHQKEGKVVVQASIGDRKGSHVLIAGEGEGAVSALVNALERQTHIHMTVSAFDEYALEEGTEASAMACVRIATEQGDATGVARAKDTTAAVMQAVLNAVGQLQQVAVEMSSIRRETAAVSAC